MERTKLSIKKKIIIFFLLFIFIYFLYFVKGAFVPFFMAIILTYLLNPLVEFFEQKLNFNRLCSILAVYLILIIIIFNACFFGFPVMVKQLALFVEKIPAYTNEIQAFIDGCYDNYRNFNLPISIRESIDGYILKVEHLLIGFFTNILNGTINLFSQLFNLIVAPIITFYFLKDKEVIRNGIVSIVPEKIIDEILDLLSQVNLVINNFIKGNLLISLAVAVMTTIGLLFIKMDFPLLLGIIYGLSDIIPYFGPIIGAIPAILLGLLHSKEMALYVLIVMIVVQQIENAVLSPKILGDSVGLHPLVVFFFLLAGERIGGIIGMLLAVPMAGILKILLKYILSKIFT